MAVGLGLIIASACVVNNCLDQRIDSLMARTKSRAIPSGEVSVPTALAYASALFVIGSATLILGTQILTFVAAILGFVAYVIVYGYAKRHTVYSTLIGSISGAIPPVVGYTAAAHRLDLTAGLLFAAVTFWQMPHFYGIAIFRENDYKMAKLPVWPAQYGLRSTQRQILLFIVLFGLAWAGLIVHGSLSPWSGFVLGAVCGGWLAYGLQKFSLLPPVKWGKAMFGISLLAILIFCVDASIDASILH